MSIRENLHYEMYRSGEYTPEWIKGERYEYCEDFYESVFAKGKKSLLRLAAMLHAFVL